MRTWTRTFKAANIRKMFAATCAALMILVAHGAVNAGTCITAEVDEAVRLPDGNIHDAGVIKLCLDRDYSPVASLHLAYIDDESIGMVTSRRGTSEGDADGPFMMFVRRQDGMLQLYGYALPGAGQMSTYMFKPQLRRVDSLRVAVDTAALTALSIPAGAR